MAKQERKPPKASGSGLVGGFIKLLLIGGAVYAIDRYVPGSVFFPEKAVDAQIAAYPLTVYPMSQLRQFRARCSKVSSSAQRRRCRAHYKELYSEHNRVMRLARADWRRVSSKVRRQATRCRRLRDRAGRDAHDVWQRDAKLAQRELAEWGRNGGLHPGFYPVTPPAPCKRSSSRRDVSSRARRR